MEFDEGSIETFCSLLQHFGTNVLLHLSMPIYVHGPRVSATISNFTPKPHTPFQWHSVSTAEFERKQKMLKAAFKEMYDYGGLARYTYAYNHRPEAKDIFDSLTSIFLFFFCPPRRVFLFFLRSNNLCRLELEPQSDSSVTRRTHSFNLNTELPNSLTPVASVGTRSRSTLQT